MQSMLKYLSIGICVFTPAFAAGCQDDSGNDKIDSESAEDSEDTQSGTETEDPQQEFQAGPVVTCFGDCPIAECDDDGFWSGNLCSDVWPEPVDESFDFCGGNTENGGYCLIIETDDFEIQYVAVNCSDDTPMEICIEHGCGFAGGEYYCN